MLAVSGCSELAYYAQAARGQLEILGKRDSIEKLVVDESQTKQTRDSLLLVKQIRDYATDELGLPDNMSYRYYSELGRQYVLWNVLAAPRYQMKLENWCFPIAGCVAYKGYFSKDNAQAFKADMVEQGYDTFLYGVTAYSTLGWFSDPVLDTFLQYPEFSLAGIIFHELAHQVVYVKDDSSFNEAFATVVEQAGVEKWILAHYPAEELQLHQLNQDRSNSITELILKHRKQLETLYASAPESDLEQRKQKIIVTMKNAYSEIQGQGGGTRYYDWWFGLELNNAHFSSIATYHRLVPSLRAALEAAGSLPEFYRQIEEKAQLPAPQRQSWIKSLGNG